MPRHRYPSCPSKQIVGSGNCCVDSRCNMRGFRISCLSDKFSGIAWKQITHHVLDQGPLETVVSCGYRRVGGEQGALRKLLSCPALVEHLQHGKGAMALVEMHPGEIVAECLERSDTTNTQQVLLAHTCAIIAPIEASAEANKFSRVVWVERVKEVHGYYMAADADDTGFPNAGIER